jgi:oxygen-independent coproporphyrinogen-3 oxidase
MNVPSATQPHPPPEEELFRSNSIGLYLHFPFCSEQCSYCGFVTRKFRAHAAETYLGLLEKELRLLASAREQQSGALPPTDTLYLGGGTPSLMTTQEIQQLTNLLRGLFPFPKMSEWTIEANPADITEAKAEAWLNAGFNRVSIGAQTISPALLQRLHRRHGPDDVLQACALLRAAGVPQISLDLIAGLPDQDIGRELDWLLSLAPDHVSIYLLEVKEKTPLESQVRTGTFVLPDPDTTADDYLQIVETLTRAGYYHYEISNFAKRPPTGPECARCSRHNLKYWAMQPVWAAGLGAHGFDGASRWAGESRLPAYRAKLEQSILPYAWQRQMSTADLLEEAMLMGMRRTKGVNLPELRRHFPATILDPVLNVLEGFLTPGWLVKTKEQYLRFTLEGMLLSNEIFEAVLEALEPFAAQAPSAEIAEGAEGY